MKWVSLSFDHFSLFKALALDKGVESRKNNVNVLVVSSLSGNHFAFFVSTGRRPLLRPLQIHKKSMRTPYTRIYAEFMRGMNRHRIYGFLSLKKIAFNEQCIAYCCNGVIKYFEIKTKQRHKKQEKKFDVWCTHPTGSKQSTAKKTKQ